jgi:hypothetical protein
VSVAPSTATHVPVRIHAVEAEGELLCHEVDVVGERELLDGRLELAVVWQPEVLDEATDGSLLGGEFHEVHVRPDSDRPVGSVARRTARSPVAGEEVGLRWTVPKVALPRVFPYNPHTNS